MTIKLIIVEEVCFAVNNINRRYRINAQQEIQAIDNAMKRNKIGHGASTHRSRLRMHDRFLLVHIVQLILPIYFFLSVCFRFVFAKLIRQLSDAAQRFLSCVCVSTRDVNIGFLSKPVIGFGKSVLNRLSGLLTFIII